MCVAFVQVREVTFTPQADKKSSVWNVDGKIFPEPSLRVRVKRRHVELLLSQRVEEV